MTSSFSEIHLKLMPYHYAQIPTLLRQPVAVVSRNMISPPQLVNFSGVVCQGKADDTNLNIL